MYTIFTALALRMSVVTTIVMLIKWIFGTKISAKWHNLLWLIPFTQFVFCLLNIRIESDISIYNYAYNVPAKQIVSYDAIISKIWLSGATVLLLWYTGILIHTYIRIRKLPDADIYPENERRLLGIKKTPSIKKSKSPACFGRYILLPDNSNKFIVLHELSHYKGKDCRKIRIALIVLCINWFNPIMWLAYKMFITDLEMLCDERILKFTDNKKEYAGILVRESSKEIFFTPGAAFVHNGKHELFKRIKRIASYGKKNPVWCSFLIVICIAISVIFLTDKQTFMPEITVINNTVPTPVPDNEPTPDVEITPVPTQSSVVIKKNAVQKSPKKYSAPTPKKKVQNTPSPKHLQTLAVPEETPAPEVAIIPEPVYISEVIPEADLPEESTSPKIPVTEMEIGSTKAEIYEKSGAPENSSANGSREIYMLEDGKQAVLQYNGDVLENAYILEN